MNIKILIFLIAVSLACLASCKKNNDAPVVSLTSRLSVVNASADSVNIYLNGTRLNTTSNLYPGNAAVYLPVDDGAQNYQLKKVFNPQTGKVEPLFNIGLNLEAARYYSLFVTSPSASLAFSVVDTPPKDTTGTFCFVRFVNAASDAGNLDMKVGSTNSFGNVAFKSASQFTLVKLGTAATPVAIYTAGAATPLFSKSISLLPGLAYTLYASGLLQGTHNSALGIGTMVNFN